VRLRRGIKARGNCLAGHHEVGGRAARGGRRGQKKATEVGRRGGKDTSDKRSPVVTETRERRPAREGVIRKGKHIFAKTRLTRGLDGPAETISACGDGAAGGLAGPEAERAAGLAGPKVRKNDF
jgi:hypothetical protein